MESILPVAAIPIIQAPLLSGAILFAPMDVSFVLVAVVAVSMTLQLSLVRSCPRLA